MNSLKQMIRRPLKNKYIEFFLKISVTVLIIFLIIRNIPVDAYKAAYQSLTAKTALFLIFSVIFQIIILALRWRYLIYLTTDKKLSLTDTIKGIFISFFVSQGLLASIGGDAFKIWWMKKNDIATQSAIKITLMDRIYGLVSLMLLCVLSLALFFIFIDVPHRQIMSLLIVIIFVGLLLCLFFVPLKFKFPFNLRKSKAFLATSLTKLMLFSQQLRESFSHQKPLSFLVLIVMSFLAHGIVIVQAYLVGQTINPSQITFLICVLAVPPSIFVTYMPFSIAGWGIREASMVMAFGLVGIGSATSFIVSITIGMAVFVTSCAGGIFWIFVVKKNPINSN